MSETPDKPKSAFELYAESIKAETADLERITARLREHTELMQIQIDTLRALREHIDPATKKTENIIDST